MNKVITINLGGNAYQLEEAGYDALRIYLETAAARLKDNPDREEILSDIEGAIAEKFRALLGSHKTVVVAREVAAVLAEMGPIEGEAGTSTGKTRETDASGTGPDAKEQPAGSGPSPRRLYRIVDGSMICGVCNGIAAYFNVDPTLIRLAFVFLTIFWGTGVLVYLIMAVVVPEAHTPEEKAAASGSPMTAQEFIRRAKEGYYEAMKNFPSRKAHREWARQFRRDARAWTSQWRYNWQWPGWQWHWPGGWTGRAPQWHPGMGLTLPLLSLVGGAVTILWLCALISLLATGAVLGMTLPASVPVWLAAVVLFFAYAMLTGSLKAARRLCYWGLGNARGAWSLLFLVDGIVWVAVAAILLAMAVHFFPELRNAIQAVPGQAHQAVHDIQAWWNGK